MCKRSLQRVRFIFGECFQLALFLLARSANQLLVLWNKWRLVFVKEVNNWPTPSDVDKGKDGAIWWRKSMAWAVWWSKELPRRGASILCGVLRHPTSLRPRHFTLGLVWAGTAGLSVASGTDTVIDNVVPNDRQKDLMCRSWHWVHAGAEEEGFLCLEWWKEQTSLNGTTWTHGCTTR